MTSRGRSAILSCPAPMLEASLLIYDAMTHASFWASCFGANRVPGAAGAGGAARPQNL
jgi:hypothetical protein